jgi:hypothetical protein
VDLKGSTIKSSYTWVHSLILRIVKTKRKFIPTLRHYNLRIILPGPLNYSRVHCAHPSLPKGTFCNEEP